jgi:hypothetical protein
MTRSCSRNNLLVAAVPEPLLLQMSAVLPSAAVTLTRGFMACRLTAAACAALWPQAHTMNCMHRHEETQWQQLRQQMLNRSAVWGYVCAVTAACNRTAAVSRLGPACNSPSAGLTPARAHACPTPAAQSLVVKYLV